MNICINNQIMKGNKMLSDSIKADQCEEDFVGNDYFSNLCFFTLCFHLMYCQNSANSIMDVQVIVDLRMAKHRVELM